MSDVRYRFMKPDEVVRISELIIAAFDEFIGPEYTPQGIEEFRKYVQPNVLLERINQEHFVLVAARAGDLIGMIEMRQNNHVALLFVAKRAQGQGIARDLLHHALAEARSQMPELARVTVNSSRYGVSAYQKLGFRQTGPERVVNGIVFIPMAKRLEGVA